MTDEKDPPIVRQEFLGGVKVVDIGDLRVARGFSRRPFSSCKHTHMVYDGGERRIWCEDCERTIDPFDAFTGLVERVDRAYKALEAARQETDEAQQHALRSIAAKNIDKAWRSHLRVPACPHCGLGLFPEHFKGRCATLGKDYARAALTKRGKPVPGPRA